MTTIDAVTDAAIEELTSSHPEMGVVGLQRIVDAAREASRLLRTDAWGVGVEAVIAPGDGSVYRYVVLAKPPVVLSGDRLSPGWSGVQHPWFVALTDPVTGAAHEWSGDPVHYTYCAEKWTRDRTYDAAVLSVFLGALSRELA